MYVPYGAESPTIPYVFTQDEVSTSSGTEKAMCGTAGSLLNFSDGGVMHFSMLFRR